MYANVVGNIWKGKNGKKERKYISKRKKGNQTHEGLYDTTEKTTKKDLLKRGGLLFSQRLNT